MWTLEMDNGRFYVYHDETGNIEALSSISAIAAYKEAVKAGYEMKGQTWINNGQVDPILFSTEVK